VQGAPQDTTPPSTPGGLSGSAISQTQVSLTWTASTDNVAVTGYQVFRNGTLVGLPTTNAYIDTNLVASTPYTYTVKAIDAAGNLSPASTGVNITTLAMADVTPPSVSITAPSANLAANTAQTTLSATTNENATCRYSTNVAFTFAAGTLFTTTGAISHSTTLTGLLNSTSYTYYVKCADTSNNVSGNASVTFSVATPPPPSGNGPTITSFTTAHGTASSGGISNLNIITLSGSGLSANGTVAIADGGVSQGAIQADSSGNWNFVTPALSDATHSFTASAAGSTGPAFLVSIVPEITAFSSASDQVGVTMDGLGYFVENANQPWNLTMPDTHTLRFENRINDVWSYDGTNRSEVASPSIIHPGVPATITYQFMIEPTNQISADWLVMGQANAQEVTPGTSAFGILFLHSNNLMTVQQRCGSADNSATLSTAQLYGDPSQIQYGHWYTMKINLQYGLTNGFVQVWRDGAQIVNYNGCIGYAVPDYYFKVGIYEAPPGATLAVDYRNFVISTASGPTDVTSPSSPTNLSATAQSPSQISLVWTPSTDNVAVAGYQIFRNGVQVAATNVPIYADTGLSPSTAYTYTVKALDTANNVSAASGSVSATTQASGATVCGAAASFLARAPAQDAAHTTAYQNLICGLVTDGVWPSIDVLYMLAAVDQTTALTNLTNSSYSGSKIGTPAFTANTGFSGGSPGNGIDTGWFPADGPNYTLNNASYGAWDLSNGTSWGFLVTSDVGWIAPSTFGSTPSGGTQYNINSSGRNDTPGVANTKGLWVADRTTGSGQINSQLYFNGVADGGVKNDGANSWPSTGTLKTCYTIGNPTHDCGAVYAGGHLTAAQQQTLYSRISAYMTAVAGLGGGSGGGSDTTPPAISITAPAGQLAANTTSATLSVTTNETATCTYSNLSGTAFASMTPFATTGGTSHSTTLTNLSNGSSYITFVKCKDTAGNISQDSSTSYNVPFPSQGGGGGGGGATPTTILDQTSALTGTDSGYIYNNITLRWVLPLSAWTASPSGGTQMRITAVLGSGQSSGTDPFSSFYVAQQAASSNPFDFKNTPTHITWNGGNDGMGAVGPGSVVTSDWVTLPETFDPTKSYVISAYTNTQNGPDTSQAANPTLTIYDNAPSFGGNDAQTVSANGVSYGQEAPFYPTLTGLRLISKIEIR
jgi:chitodextrinase